MKESSQNSTTILRVGRIKAVSISKEKGRKKKNVETILLKEDFGIVGDIHAGTGKRQVSLLSLESIEKMKDKGLSLVPGDFAENITTEGINLSSLKLNTKLKIGEKIILEVSQIGKECHQRCSIYYQAGDCVMPREGIFVRVLNGGYAKKGDRLEVMN